VALPRAVTPSGTNPRITTITVFISHAEKEKRVASRIKSGHAPKFKVFLAHDDINGGEERIRVLYDKIQECDVFLILLSKDYHLASFTDQETGIAYSMNKPMIPVSIDGTKPYRFMTRYQSSVLTNLTPEEVEKVPNLIIA
jgi:TIR domain-containing protein